jgi:putative redox protein
MSKIKFNKNMKSSIKANWLGGMAFEANVGGHKITVDAAKDNGGNDLGSRPKPLMMVALAGCTGMDVVSILQKMRVEFDSFSIDIEGITADEHPKKYLEMTVIYQIKGKNIDRKKVEKAVNLSIERYCGVNASYKEVIKMNYKIEIEEA